MPPGMAKLRRIVHRRRSSIGGHSDIDKEVLTLTVARDELQLLTTGVGAGVAPRKSGVLLKYTNVLKRWKPRYFELENGVLQYRAHPDDDRPDGSAPALSSDDSSGEPHHEGRRKKKKKKKLRFLKRTGSKDDKETDFKGKINLQLAVISADDSDPTKFAIDVGADVFHVKANTEADRDEWVAALNASNDYFRALIKKAVHRAKERADLLDVPSQSERPVLLMEDTSVEPLHEPQKRRVSNESSESDDTVLEDDGLREAEQSRNALVSELKRVHCLWRKSWVDDASGSPSKSDSDFLTTLADTFRDDNDAPTSPQENLRETAKGLMDLVAWCLHAMQTNDEIFQRRLKADLTRMMAGGLPVFPTSPTKKLQARREAVDDDEEDEESDSDAEFFDALSRAASIRSNKARLHPSLDAMVSEAEVEDMEEKRLSVNQVKRVDTTVISKGFRDVRTTLPKLPGPREKLNVFGILKDSVGKDLSKIVVPITLNEPLSFVQRLAEDIEYCELLDKAAAEPDPDRRLMYVATMVISHYSSTQGRVGKPFNPLLGETACVNMPNKGNGMRFVAEQVSHHPPVSACYAEGSGASWKYHNSVEIKNKFWGKSLEIFPTGLNHVKLPEHGDHYVYTQITSCVHNIVVGRMWLDNYGEMEITNRTNGGKCIISFSKTGWMSDARSFGALKGTVYDASGKVKIKLGGNWTKAVWEELPKGKRNVLWTVDDRPDDVASQSYSMTKWAISLNAEVQDGEWQYVAPTDSRLRPDQRALEAGEWALGTNLKVMLEEGQRERRKEMEEAGEEWEPLWFKKVTDEVEGVTDYEFGGEFFQKQAVGDWSRCPDLFSCATALPVKTSSSGSHKP